MRVLLLIFYCVCACLALPQPVNQVRVGGIALTSSTETVFLHREDKMVHWTLRHSDFNAVPHGFHVNIWHGVTNQLAWNSGKMVSNETQTLTMFSLLQPNTPYYLQVNWWDNNGQMAEGTHLKFHTVLAAWGDSKWIAASKMVDSPLFRRNVTVPKGTSVSHAECYVSGLGFFDMYINGQSVLSPSSTEGNPNPKVGDVTLVPGWTRFEYAAPFVGFDVSKMIPTSGELVVGINLGKGWRDRSSFPPKDKTTKADDHEAVLRFILTVDFTNGDKIVLESDANWMTAASEISYSNIYNGETQDARNYQPGWSSPGFKPNKPWTKAMVVPGPTMEMMFQQMPPVKITKMIAPTHLYYEYSHSTNYIIVDFGINSAGVCHLQFPENTKAGTMVELHHAEIPLHEPYGPKNGSLYFKNLRSAKATDMFTTAPAKGKAAVQPKFTYHGFRYVRVIGYPGSLTQLKANIKKLHFHTDLPLNAGGWKTNSYILNTIQQHLLNSHASNMMTIITDCDQRDERLGWMGDAGLSSDAMVLNYQTLSLHTNELLLMRAEQSNGTVPDVVPYYRYGNRPADPAWGLAFPQVLWTMVHYYGDLELGKTFFDACNDWLTYLTMRAEKAGGLPKIYGYYGDWVPPPPAKKISVHYTSAFATIWIAEKLYDIAQALGENSKAQALKRLLDNFTDQFNKGFVKGTTYMDGGQTALVLPMSLGIVPTSMQSDVAKQLLDDLNNHGVHTTSGIIGVKSLFPALSSIRRWDLGLQLCLQTDYPSWGWEAFNPYEPATGVWELWDAWTKGPGMNSRNHHMFSSVSAWMLTDLVGLSTKPGVNGYKEVSLTAARVLGLQSAGASMVVPKEISWNWQRHGGIQCGKQPEGQSAHSPDLPVVPELEITCGDFGGVIQNVMFASYGQPTGHCGMFKVDDSCNLKNSKSVVEKYCLNKKSCSIPTQSSIWGDPCFGKVKRLYVQVQCSEPLSIRAETLFPVGTTADITFPLWALKDPKVTFTYKTTSTIWDNNTFHPTKEITSGTYNKMYDELKFVGQGVVGNHRPYEFAVTGSATGDNVVLTVPHGEIGTMSCPEGHHFAHIRFASYGNPDTTDELLPTVGSCHAGNSVYSVEQLCLGETQCQVPATAEVFGEHECGVEQLHVVAACTNAGQ